jgi:transcriptional regulator with XRE-family HTH domain
MQDMPKTSLPLPEMRQNRSGRLNLMKIAAITKFKHGEMYKAMKQVDVSTPKLAKATGLSYHTLLKFLNMVRRPTEEQAQKLQLFFGRFDIFVDLEMWWPQEFSPLKKSAVIEQIADIPIEAWLSGSVQAALPPDEVLMQQETGIEKALATLRPREQYILRQRFLEGEIGSSTAENMGISPVRRQQIEATALRKLRHPSRLRLLEAPC